MLVFTHYFFGDVYLCTVVEFVPAPTPEEIFTAAAVAELVSEVLDLL